MAHYFIFPEKDTTLYSHPTRNEANMGIDEILTLTDEDYLGKKYPSRILIKFKTTDIDNIINNKVSGNFSASLKLWATEHSNLSLDQHFEVYPLAEDWDNGTGRYNNNPYSTDGASWKYKDNDTNETTWTNSGWGTGITASYSSSNPGGGSWYTGSGFEVSETYSYVDELDLAFDVTSPITKFYSASQKSATYPEGITNNGFILKRSESQEFNAIEDGQLNFFSVDTHTIYPPYIDISWDDSNYDTGSATDNTILKTGDCYLTLRNNKKEFRQGEEIKFRLNVRELYPTRRFVTSSNYLDVKHFTSKSYYSVVDYATNDTIIPFDDYTKLSADNQGMYFKFYMNGLEAERYYRLLFKHENEDGIVIYDEDYYFKVVN